jgi:hypothetical protein
MVLKLTRNAHNKGDADFDLDSGFQIMRQRALGQP